MGKRGAPAPHGARQTLNMFGGAKKDNSITAIDSGFVIFGNITHAQQNRKSLYASADLVQHSLCDSAAVVTTTSSSVYCSLLKTTARRPSLATKNII